jgi:hypothetical protein
MFGLRSTLAGEITEKNERVRVKQPIEQSLLMAQAYGAIPSKIVVNLCK